MLQKGCGSKATDILQQRKVSQVGKAMRDPNEHIQRSQTADSQSTHRSEILDVIQRVLEGNGGLRSELTRRSEKRKKRVKTAEIGRAHV
jgi:hypothetical protein